MCGLHILKGKTGEDLVSQGRPFFFFTLLNMLLINNIPFKGSELYFRDLGWEFLYTNHLWILPYKAWKFTEVKGVYPF